MGKGVWPNFSEISRTGPRGGFLNMAEFDQRMSNYGQKGKMILIDKEGSLMTAGEYAQIFPDPGPYSLGKLPYFLKISKIRESIYCAENICNPRTYSIWRNMIYRAGYAETMIGEPRRHLATSELQLADQYFCNLVWETAIVDKFPARNAMGRSLTDYRLMVELLPKSDPLGRPSGKPSISGAI